MSIKISITNKIASLVDETAFIVCGNSDYTIEFAFTDEWSEYDDKTARFIFGGKHIDITFCGNSCKAPIIANAREVLVGVIAGELSTTTPARIECKKSVACDDVAGTKTEGIIAINSSHTHGNQEVLDAITQEMLNAIGSGGAGGTSGTGLTEEQAADLAANTEARHEHRDINTLNKIHIFKTTNQEILCCSEQEGAVDIWRSCDGFLVDGVYVDEETGDTTFAIRKRAIAVNLPDEYIIKAPPTKLSQLENDSGFITAKDIPTSGTSTTSNLKNLKCGILGDSITAGAGVKSAECYPTLLKADFKEVINYGISATLIAKDDSYSNAMCERYVNMADDLDVIIVMGGTNDFAVGSRIADSFGEPTSTDPYTFYGALNILMSGLVNKYVGKEIFFCTPIHINYNGHHSDTAKPNGKVLNDYRNAIIERCAYYSIPCIDLYATSGMDIAHNESVKNYFTTDGCHPNVKGHIRLHDRILHEVKNRIGYNTVIQEETVTLESISAVFNQGNTVIYTDTTLNSLKNMLTVTATYTDGTTATVTDYTLSGTLAVGTSVITVNYSGKTATFDVNVTEEAPTPTDGNIIAELLASGDYEYGYINDINGSYVTAAASQNMGASDYIEVNGGDTVEGKLLTGTGVALANFGCVYDENKKYIKSLCALNNNQKSNPYTITLPENARYVRLTLLLTVDTNYFRIVQQ